MIAICGINCGECACFKATVSSDAEKLEQVAKEWSSGENKYEAKDMVCLGCGLEKGRGRDELMFTWCRSCEIRVCAVEKGVINCAVCEDFGHCPKIGAFLGRMAGSGSKIPGMMQLMSEKVSLHRREAAATSADCKS